MKRLTALLVLSALLLLALPCAAEDSREVTFEVRVAAKNMNCPIRIELDSFPGNQSQLRNLHGEEMTMKSTQSVSEFLEGPASWTVFYVNDKTQDPIAQFLVNYYYESDTCEVQNTSAYRDGISMTTMGGYDCQFYFEVQPSRQ